MTKCHCARAQCYCTENDCNDVNTVCCYSFLHVGILEKGRGKETKLQLLLHKFEKKKLKAIEFEMMSGLKSTAKLANNGSRLR